MKYNKEAVEAYLKNDIAMCKKLELEHDPVIILLGNIQDGLFYEHACDIAGIGQTQFYSWKKRKATFAKAVRIADSRAIQYHNKNIRSQADKDWRASAWFLAKKDKRYREEQKIEHDLGTMDVVHIYKPDVENK